MDSFNTGGNWCMCRAFSLGNLNVFHYDNEKIIQVHAALYLCRTPPLHLHIFRIWSRGKVLDIYSLIMYQCWHGWQEIQGTFPSLKLLDENRELVCKDGECEMVHFYGFQQWPLREGNTWWPFPFQLAGLEGSLQEIDNIQVLWPWPDISTQISTRILL